MSFGVELWVGAFTGLALESWVICVTLDGNCQSSIVLLHIKAQSKISDLIFSIKNFYLSLGDKQVENSLSWLLWVLMGQGAGGGDEQQEQSVAVMRMTSYFSWYIIKTWFQEAGTDGFGAFFPALLHLWLSPRLTINVLTIANSFFFFTLYISAHPQRQSKLLDLAASLLFNQ